jgi:cysteine-rich repeat protein
LASVCALVVLAGGAAAQVSSDDRACIEAINGETRKLALAVHKEVGSCVADFAKGTLAAPTVVGCAGPATSLSVQKAVEKALEKAADRCGGTPPSFGPPSIVAHPDRTLAAIAGLLGDFFGAPVEGGLATEAKAAACQKIVLKSAVKCQSMWLREFNKCKKIGMLSGAVDDAASLRDACLGTGAGRRDPLGKIATLCVDKPRALIAARCQNAGVPIADAFPACGATNTAGMTACFDERIACRTCELLNAVDGLTRDCDLLDDGNDANQSCSEPTTCGDGLIDGLEACDDGNATSGDGCDASCQLEAGWECSGAPTVCEATCGDGLVVGAEACDDGATTPGDGCDASCETEPGWTCAGAPSACSAVCGDGLLRDDEQCDDGDSTAGDGCSASCVPEAGWTCSGEPSVCTATCGDGLVRGGEACDDGDTASGDGCDATCVVETGFTCAGQPSTCTAICGDGLILGAEACDDGCGSPGGAFPGGCGSTGGAFPAPGDGCDASCQIEIGWGCSGQPSACTPICGDGLILGDETCDDGDLTPGDGCNGACRIEAGYNCAGEPSHCASICGDGLVVGSETCDDGELQPGDGCDDVCRTEPGYACTGQPSTCQPVCGDGQTVGSETCDDGNAVGFDGCSALCEIEPGFVCSGVPSTCQAFHVVITSPANGTFITASSVTVEGVIVSLLPAQASLRINGVTVPVAPNGTFSKSIALDFDEIFNPIRATVTHTGTGSSAHHRVTVIAGDSVVDGELSFESVALRINDSGLDQVEPLVADLAGTGLDLADLVPVGTVVASDCFIDSIFGCLGSGTVRIVNPPPSFSSFSLAIDSMTNFVAGDITVYDIRVDTHLSGSGLVPSCDIDITANAAFFNGDYGLEPHPSDPTRLDVNQLGGQQVSFTGFDVSYGDICDVPIIGDIIQAFMPDVQALAINGIANFLADPDGAGPLDSPTADAIEQALAGIQITGPISEGLGMNLDAPLFEVSEDDVGITLGCDSRFTTEIGTGPGQCVPPPGAPNLTRSYATNTTFPLFGGTTPEQHLPFDLSISISSEGFNQLLKAQTECGLLVTSIDELSGIPLNALLLSALLPEFAIYPPSTPFRIDVQPTLAPIVSGEEGPNGELAELKVAQILISVVQNDGTEAVALQGAIDANIGLELSFADGGLGIGLTPPEPSDIRVAILYNPLGVDESNLENNVLPPLVALLLPDLAGSLASFPLPDFLGLHLEGVEVSRIGDFMSLFANLEPGP